MPEAELDIDEGFNNITLSLVNNTSNEYLNSINLTDYDIVWMKWSHVISGYSEMITNSSVYTGAAEAMRDIVDATRDIVMKIVELLQNLYEQSGIKA